MSGADCDARTICATGPLEAALRVTSMTVDLDYSVALNHIAAVAARQSGRLAAMVFDWVPAIHQAQPPLSLRRTCLPTYTYTTCIHAWEQAFVTCDDPEPIHLKRSSWCIQITGHAAARLREELLPCKVRSMSPRP